MSEQEIQPGARVRVSFEANYQYADDAGYAVVEVFGKEHYLPGAAEIEVLSPPPPPEPPMGTYVELTWRTGDTGVYQRRLEDLDGHTGPSVRDAWWSVDPGDVMTWPVLCSQGTVTVLHRDGPQYEAAHHRLGYLWQHACGTAAPFTAEPDAPRCGMHCTASFGRWRRLYVRAGQSDD